MGLFDTSQSAQEFSNSTVRPVIPNYLIKPVGAYTDKLDEYLRSSPNQYVTPINSIQQQVYGAAGMSPDEWLDMSYSPGRLWLNPPETPEFTQGTPSAFGTATPYYNEALDMTRGVADPSLTQAGLPDRYDVANVADIGSRGFVSADVGTLGDAQRAGYTGYDAPTLGPAETWQGQGYDAALVGNVADEYLAGDIERADAASLLDNFDAYMNPYLEDVVDTSLADYDVYADRLRAQQEATAAKNRAFGGSANAFAESALGADLTRGRAATSAGLRSDAFRQAAELSDLDAGRRQETSALNAQMANQRDLQRAQMALEARGLDAGFINASREFAQNARNQSERDRATAQNEFRLKQAGMDEASARYLADAFNLSERDYAQALRDFSLARFEQEGLTSRTNAQLGSEALADTFAAERARAELDAAAENAARGQFYSTEAETARRNAEMANRNAEYIASLGLDRAGQIAGIGTALASDTRADLDMQRAIGNELYELMRKRQRAPVEQLATGGQLLGDIPWDSFVGKSIESRGQTNQSGGGGIGGLLALGSLFL